MTITLRSKNRALAEAAIKLLEAERPMTLRQLFYRLISAGEISNSKAEYNRVKVLMKRLREAGQVPRRWLVDHTRATLKRSSWSGLADFAETVRHAYRKDFWASMSDYVDIFVEKDAVAGTLQPTAEKYDVPLRVLRGYSSISFAGEIADEWREIEKPIFAYYVGDYDPSGFDLERDLCEKLARYSDREFAWKRLGVCREDFDELDLIPLPTKATDTRAAGFSFHRGDACAELDAIPPTELRRRLEEAILGHIDAERWKKLLLIEEAEQETLNQFIAGMRGDKLNLGSVSVGDDDRPEANA